MDARLGLALAVAALALGYVQYGWQGVLLALSAIVFWMLMQFTRALRVMRMAGNAPIGSIPSAVMLNAQLKPGQRLMDVIQRTHSLGEKLSDAPETYRWTDGAGASVTIELADGRCVRWTLARPADQDIDGG